MSFFYLLSGPLSLLIRPVYEYTHNYGWTLVIVTVLINLLTIPLTVISQRSMAKTQQLQPLLAELQRKYQNDKEKYSAEMQKLYTKYQINPMSGCLPLLVRMFIIFGFIGVVYNPLQYLLRLDATQIQTIKDAVTAAGASIPVYEVQLCGMPGVDAAIRGLGLEPINFNFLGIDLTKMLRQNMGDVLVWIIPVMAVLATVGSTIITKKMNPNQNGTDQAAAMSNSMLMIMPVMTAYFTFIMPIGMSLYWFTSTLVNTIQQVFVNGILKSHKANLHLTPGDEKLLKSSLAKKEAREEKEAKKQNKK